MLGDLVALAMVFASALYVVLIRRHPGCDAVLSGVVTSVQLFLVALVLGEPLAVSARDLWLSALFGLSMAAGFILWTEGARRIPSAEVGVLGTAETPLALLAGWWLLAEAPPATSLGGGAVVLGAVLWRGMADLRGAPPVSSSAR
jgi:drug/metabolite transporter (DMT)-like permease